MAITFFHIKGTTPLTDNSIELPKQGCRIFVDGTDGVVVTLTTRFWSCRNTGRDVNNSPIETPPDIYYRQVLIKNDIAAYKPVISGLSNSTPATVQSVPIIGGQDEIVQVQMSGTPESGRDAESTTARSVYFLSSGAGVQMLIRPNEPLYSAHR